MAIIIFLLTFLLTITFVASSSCSWADFKQGSWYTYQTNTTYRGKCLEFGDRREHANFRWRPTHAKCRVHLDLQSINSCFRNATIIFVGDSHYQQAGLSMLEYFRNIPHEFRIESYFSKLLVNGYGSKTVAKEVAKAVKKADILILGTGHHFARGKFGNTSWDKMMEYASDAVTTTLDYVKANFRGKKVVWYSYTPRHFENGEWDGSGVCNNVSDVPTDEVHVTLEEKEYYTFWQSELQHVQSYMLDIPALTINPITEMSLKRPGSHVSTYARNNNGKFDCSHYCSPGVPDEWNRQMVTIACLL